MSKKEPSYKKKIMDLLKKVDDEIILKRVYKLLVYLYLKSPEK